MKVSCLQENLSRGLSIVARAVAPRSTLPVLGNVLLATDQGRLRLSATNLEMGITCWIGAKVTEDGSTTVPARTFVDLINTLPSQQVDMDLTVRTQTLNVRSGSYNNDIKCIDAQDFPPMPPQEIDGGLELNIGELREMISQVSFAASLDDARPVLTGVLLEIEDGEMTFAAADGFRLSVRKAHLPSPATGPVKAIIPAKALSELARILGEDDKTVAMLFPPIAGRLSSEPRIWNSFPSSSKALFLTTAALSRHPSPRGASSPRRNFSRPAKRPIFSPVKPHIQPAQYSTWRFDFQAFERVMRATADEASPSFRPTKPRPSVVVALTFDRVQTVLRRNGRGGGSHVTNRRGALLKGLLYCGPCGYSMSHTYTNKGNRRYRYYVCINAQKRGWQKCPSKSIPAREIERFVVDQIKCIGQDQELLSKTLAEATSQGNARIREIEAEQAALKRELGRNNTETQKLIGRLSCTPDEDSLETARLADLQERIQMAEQRITTIREEAAIIERNMIDEKELSSALVAFEPVWESLAPKEQSRILHLLVERIEYDGQDESISITFRPSGIKTLAEQFSDEIACKE